MFSSSGFKSRHIVGMLAHMHSRAALLEPNFIHQCSHQVDAASVQGHNVLRTGWIRHGMQIESRSLVADRDRDFSLYAAAAYNLHTLMRVLVIAMDNGIREGLTQRSFDVELGAVHAAPGDRKSDVYGKTLH